MTISLDFHPDAVVELEEATEWYRARSPRAAQGFVDELAQVLDDIVQAPQRWPRGPAGTRRLPFHRFPFTVIYRQEPAAIKIVAVAHGRRKPNYWRDRY